MVVLVALVVGAVPAAAIWLLARDVFAHPTLARRNVRGIDVPTAGGIVIALALLPGFAVMRVVEAQFGSGPRASLGWELWYAFAIVPVAVAFGLLGLIDDLLARGDDRGFRGHLGALFSGRLTTGGIKLVGGGLAALSLSDGSNLGWLLANAAVIALAANLANLLDRAPGRTTKVSVLALGALVVAGLIVNPADGEVGGVLQRSGLAGAALVVGAAVGMLFAELREQVMLGDTGANALGAVLGFTLVAQFGPPATVIALVLLVVLNLASETVSFSTVIDRTPPLRWLDQLGRRPT